MKVKINKDEHSPTIVVEFSSLPNQLDHDKIHSLESIIGQHSLNTETIDETVGHNPRAGATTKKLIIKDVTDAFETDLQHWVFTGDIR
jgi:hypothetical protein